MDDLSDGDAIELIDFIPAHFGGIDLLINNAGISIPAPIDGDSYGSVYIPIGAAYCSTSDHQSLPHLRQSVSSHRQYCFHRRTGRD